MPFMGTTRRRALKLGVGAGAHAALMLGGHARIAEGARVGRPTISGPVHGGEHGWAYGASDRDIEALGYIEEEFFMAGTACRFEPIGPLGNDGRWRLAPVATAPYKTRILVRRPRRPEAFNGTVILLWNNVTSGYEGFSDSRAHYEGYASVAVSAQRVGVHGFARNPRGLVAWDPVRYGDLTIPGDAFSYDIFTQAARSVCFERNAGGVDPMAGLRVERIIATGASQSGARLVSYANGVQPLANVIDAIVPTLVGGYSVGFGDAAFDPLASDRSSTRIRTDLAIPVMVVNSETEVIAAFRIRQPDTDKFRYWEVAGASHYSQPDARSSAGRRKRDGTFDVATEPANLSAVSCEPAVNAAIFHVGRWLEGGSPPPAQPKIEVREDGLRIERDQYGLAKGGLRLPWITVPVARNTGDRTLGQTEPFSAEVLQKLYGTFAEYMARMETAVREAVGDGILLPVDAHGLLSRAEDFCMPGFTVPVDRACASL